MQKSEKNILQNLNTLAQKKKFIKNFCLYGKLFNFKNSESNDNLEFFINSLYKDEKTIFINNFIFCNSNPEWYLRIWSKSTYYKKLNFVVNLFMKFLLSKNIFKKSVNKYQNYYV